MQEQNVFQKVSFVIKQKYKGELEAVQKKLWAAGIETETTREEAGWQTDREITAEKYTRLIVCDEESIARHLQQAGYYVIIFCNQENQSQNFSGFTYALEGFEELDADYFIKVWQRYCGLPWQIGETKRCRIREMWEEDLDALYRLYQDPAITRYMENLYQDRALERSYIRDYMEKIYGYYGFGTWLILEKESGSLIGRAGFNYRPGFEEPELGFLIGTPWQKKGYAYEVCTWLLQFVSGVYEWERVQALVHPHNTASIALLLKLGFCCQEEITVEGQRLTRFLFTYDRKKGRLE